MISSRTSDAFLTFVRLGIGHRSAELPAEADWPAIRALAIRHGLSAVVFAGIGKKYASMQEDMFFSWAGEVIHDYEHRYEAYKRAIAEIARFYNSHGFKMMVLKGYACSLDWPSPDKRPCGDIDIWLFGKQKEADEELLRINENEKINENDNENEKINENHNENLGNRHIVIDSSHHHTVYKWNEFDVENHYDFINVHHHKSNKEFEKILKQLGEDDSHYVEVGGEKICLPSSNLHALFLLKHLMMHFASEGIRLGQVLDWGFFMEKHGKEVDWDYVDKVLDSFGMYQMFNIINAICVEDLGFDEGLFPKVLVDPSLKDRVLKEILTPQHNASLPKNIFRRLLFKIRRWTDNEWKHKLCYKDSMWSAFWSGVWSHLLKPSSI